MQNIRERKKKERNKKKRKERRKRKRSCIIHNAIDALKLGYWFRFYTSLTVCNSPDVIGNKAKRLYLEYYYVRV